MNSEIEQFPDVLSLLDQLGYHSSLSSSWYKRIAYWGSWYKGQNSFHNYKTYNGNEFVNNKRFSLRMAKTLSEDRADILLNEHTDITVMDIKAQEYLDNLFENEDFWCQANQLIEDVAWSGTGAIVVSRIEDENNETVSHLDFVNGSRIYPLAWQGNKITACAFASPYMDMDKGQLMYIVIHGIDPKTKTYHVRNYLFDINSKKVALPEGVPAEWDSESKYPTYQIIKLGMRNNLERENPMGISIYANALDILKTLDCAFDSLANEFMLGRKRIFVDSSLMNVSLDTGESKPVFDHNDTVFYGLPGMGRDDTNHGLPIIESNMKLRVPEHVDTIQANLDLLSLKTGFGRGFYRFEAMQVTTATEVISTDAKMYRRLRKDEIPIESALIGLTRVLLFFGSFDPMQEISVRFDDSVIEDTNAVAQRNLQELASGVISLEQYNARVNNLREGAAAKLTRKTLMQRKKAEEFMSSGEAQEQAQTTSQNKEPNQKQEQNQKQESEDGSDTKV